MHLYTALGAVAGLVSIDYAARGDFRASFIAMAVATAIDSSDGPLARLLEVRRRIPHFDGALLDNIVDYLTYVLAPVFLMLRAGILEPGLGGYLVGGFAMLASGYGFCHVEAKTDDHYFRGFPSYWNLVAFYLYCLGLGALAGTIVVAVFAVMVFVPIKYIYPNRTGPLRARYAHAGDRLGDSHARAAGRVARESSRTALRIAVVHRLLPGRLVHPARARGAETSALSVRRRGATLMTGSRGGPHSFDQAAAPKSARWLQAADGDAPVLLIAPHGGQAGPATRALLNPKVNDLYTADITHELAQRLGAGAIINSGMDRNRLDLNRLSQVMSEAPWMLELIAARLERIVAQRGRAVVLLIHGWNVIEPRVDVGIGVKSANGALLPACGAHVSASDGFVNGPLVDFFEVLGRSGIEPTFGLRYPGAGANNLLQAFTQRHASSPIGTLRRLAALNARGALEAVQLELSVALRMPGRFRAKTIAAIAESFARCDLAAAASTTNGVERTSRIEIMRTAEVPAPTPRRRAPQTSAGPLRVGLEFYDSSAQIGAMASFDLGSGAAGARVMVMLGRERIALFTAEGRVARTAAEPDAGSAGFANSRRAHVFRVCRAGGGG